MWSALAVCVVFYYLGDRILSAWTLRWRGVSVRYGAIEYWTATSVAGRHSPFTRVGVSAPAGFDFSIRWKSETARWCEKVGLSVKFQVGDEFVDRWLHVESDDARVHSALVSNPLVRRNLQIFFTGARSTGLMIYAIRCARGRVFVEGSHDLKTGPHQLEIAALPILQQLGKALQEQDTSIPVAAADPYASRTEIVLSVIRGTAACGFAGWFLSSLGTAALLVPHSLLEIAMVAAFVTFVVAGWLIWRLLGRSARFSRILLSLLLIGLPGWIMTNYWVVTSVNQSFAAPTTRTVSVKSAELEKFVGRRAFTSFSLSFFDPATRSPKRFEVDHDTANLITRGTQLPGTVGPIRLQVRDGALGVAWVESLDVRPARHRRRSSGN
jgi:hypothetical protein